MKKDRFTLKVEHLKMAGNLYFRYDEGCEFGAPAIDPKRPYGNSDVYGDIAEIIGIESTEGEYTDSQRDYMHGLHVDMQNFLQIIVDTESWPETGVYEREKYGGKWELT